MSSGYAKHNIDLIRQDGIVEFKEQGSSLFTKWGQEIQVVTPVSQNFLIAAIGKEDEPKEYSVIIQERPDNFRSFPGELCPPGGAADTRIFAPGADEESTKVSTIERKKYEKTRNKERDGEVEPSYMARLGSENSFLAGIRETEEEMGIKPKDLFLLSGPNRVLSPGGYEVAISSTFIEADTLDDLKAQLKPNESEVGTIYAVELEKFLTMQPTTHTELHHKDWRHRGDRIERVEENGEVFYKITNKEDLKNPNRREPIMLPLKDNNSGKDSAEKSIVALRRDFHEISREDLGEPLWESSQNLSGDDSKEKDPNETLLFRSGPYLKSLVMHRELNCIKPTIETVPTGNGEDTRVVMNVRDGHFDREKFDKIVQSRLKSQYTVKDIGLGLASEILRTVVGKETAHKIEALGQRFYTGVKTMVEELTNNGRNAEYFAEQSKPSGPER